MRIALVHPFVWPDVRRGAERYVDDLAWYLVGRGHDVELVTGTDGPDRTEQRADGVVVHHRHHVGMVKLARLGVDKVQAFLLTSFPALRRGQYDVVHAMVPAAACAARLSRTPAVLTFIGHPTKEQYDALTRFDRALYRTASHVSSASTALSRASAGSVEDLFGRRPDVLAPGVRTDRFPLDARPRSGPPRLLFSAAPGDRRKHLDLLLRAMPAVLDRHPDARLAVSGQGDPSWALATVGAADQPRVRAALDVTGTGAVDDIPARYRSATATILPAVDEAFGLALVESLASGTPVVATADGGMVDIVTDPAVGRTFPAGSVEGLVEAVHDVVALASVAGTPEACSEHARAWSWTDAVGPAHEQLYQRITG
jgi:glycosyltransferase involved in cell wall biosynthesis